MWTPQTGKWINPKYAAKETPTEQFQWAIGFYESGNYKKAIAEFRKILRFYPLSKYASEAQYYIGRSNEELGNFYQAFKDYQTVIDKYPYTERIEEAIRRQYQIGNLFYEGRKTKIFGLELTPSLDKAVEIYQQVIDNAPYGKFADIAQYRLGLAYEKGKDYINASVAFKRVIENYPNSDLVDDAKYRLAVVSLKDFERTDYNAEGIDRAREEFESFLRSYPDTEMRSEAQKIITELDDKKAENEFRIAQFYEKQKKFKSAAIYYQSIVDDYPGSNWSVKALEKLQLYKKQGKLD
jgi:outer membrane protein assembly factor BamD